MNRQQWLGDLAERGARVGHVADAVRLAVDEGRSLDRGWPSAVVDLLSTLEGICDRGNHPDDVAAAMSAITSLAGLWFTVEQVDAVYLGDGVRSVPPEGVVLRRRTPAEAAAWVDGLDDPDASGPSVDVWRRLEPEARIAVREIVLDVAGGEPL